MQQTDALSTAVAAIAHVRATLECGMLMQVGPNAGVLQSVLLSLPEVCLIGDAGDDVHDTLVALSVLSPAAVLLTRIEPGECVEILTISRYQAAQCLCAVPKDILLPATQAAGDRERVYSGTAGEALWATAMDFYARAGGTYERVMPPPERVRGCCCV